jgi:hypothetical protein
MTIDKIFTRLDLNDDHHSDGSTIKACRLWMKGGWHPPTDDPQYKKGSG